MKLDITQPDITVLAVSDHKHVCTACRAASVYKLYGAGRSCRGGKHRVLGYACILHYRQLMVIRAERRRSKPGQSFLM